MGFIIFHITCAEGIIATREGFNRNFRFDFLLRRKICPRPPRLSSKIVRNRKGLFWRGLAARFSPDGDFWGLFPAPDLP